MNKRYFVDVENVGLYWTKLFEEMDCTDLMYLYTSKNTKLTYSTLIPYMHDEKWDQLEIKETYVICVKDNNLDCFLLSDLNTIMKQNKGTEDMYVIVSKDKGYDKFIDEMVADGYEISRIYQEEVISETEPETNTTADTESLKENTKKKEPEKKVNENLKKEIAKQLRDSVIKNQGKKNHLENAYDYNKLAEIYIKEKDFKKVVDNIKDSKNASRFSSFVKSKTRKHIETLMEKK